MMKANVADLVAQAVKLQSPPRGHRVPVDSSREPLGGGCCFYGWVIVAVCILCKIFKVQGPSVGRLDCEDAGHMFYSR